MPRHTEVHSLNLDAKFPDLIITHEVWIQTKVMIELVFGC